jgi:protein-tyrosine-phosphatase
MSEDETTTSFHSRREASPLIQRLVFVCAHGAAKSVLAASYFNHLAERQHLGARAIARGTDPDAVISESVRQHLDAAGVVLCTDQPGRLTDGDGANADLLVAFDLTEQALGTRPHRSWDALPALSEDFERGHAAILARVVALVTELKARAGS